MSEPFWTPLGGQPVDYEGAWAAGVQYAPGDVVVYNGMTYLAVNPSLGSTPPLGYGGLDVGPEVAYQEFAATVAVTATTEAGANAVVTAPAFVADGSSQYLVEFAAPRCYPHNVNGASLYLGLFLDGAPVGILGNLTSPAASYVAAPVRLARRVTPAAGSRTFAVRAWLNSAGTGAVEAGVGGSGVYLPGFIRITKVPSAVPIAAGVIPPLAVVTALPASPVDGQEIILVDSLTAPTFSWHLRYMAAKASNKWIFVGGSPGFHQVDAAESPGSTSYVNLATLGPQFQIPVAGDYLVEIGFAESTSLGGQFHYMSYAIGATPASDADCISLRTTGSVSGDVGRGNNRVMRRSLGAVLLQAKYKAYDTGNALFQNRWMRVEPVAVGG